MNGNEGEKGENINLANESFASTSFNRLVNEECLKKTVFTLIWIWIVTSKSLRFDFVLNFDWPAHKTKKDRSFSSFYEFGLFRGGKSILKLVANCDYHANQKYSFIWFNPKFV